MLYSTFMMIPIEGLLTNRDIQIHITSLFEVSVEGSLMNQALSYPFVLSTLIIAECLIKPVLYSLYPLKTF